MCVADCATLLLPGNFPPHPTVAAPTEQAGALSPAVIGTSAEG